MTTDEIIFAIDHADPSLVEAFVELYKKATPEQGQHDLRNCRFCHAEEVWHGSPRFIPGVDNLTHKANCPVGKIRAKLSEFSQT